MKDIKIGLLGLGTVGSGVYLLLKERNRSIQRQIGVNAVIKRVLVKNILRNRPRGIDMNIITDNPQLVLDDDEIDVIVEVMGGEVPAFSYVKKAIKNGKHLVLANKELMAKHGKEIFDLAAKKKVDVFFEGSVAGGIPIIRALKESLSSDEITGINGIINGTTNYILSRMSHRGLNFADALKEAQHKGYAEADPSYDVNGIDAAFKLAILSSIAFNTRVTFENIHHEGIKTIEKKDIEYAKDLGYTVKLLAVARKKDGELETFVSPALLPLEHPLSSVNDVFNAILVEGKWCGNLMFYGHGAGKKPTSASVVADIIKVLRDIKTDSTGSILCTCYEKTRVKKISEVNSRFYLRIRVLDEPGVLASIAGIFAREKISFASVLQKERGEKIVDVVFITYEAPEKNVSKALHALKKLSCVHKIANAIRIEA